MGGARGPEQDGGDEAVTEAHGTYMSQDVLSSWMQRGLCYKDSGSWILMFYKAQVGFKCLVSPTEEAVSLALTGRQCQ